MKSGSYASFRAAMPLECLGEPDEPRTPTPHEIANSPPVAVVVNWVATDPVHGCCRCFKVFGAESWRWKHALAWQAAMERRHGPGSAWIEEVF